MLNAAFKRETLKKCEEETEKYQKEYESTIRTSTELHENKEKAVEYLKLVDTYIHTLSNKPKHLEKLATEIAIRREEFEKEVEQLNIESKKAEKTSKGIAGGGILAGAGVAAFGPTAAMGVATTFGTASTGTAIATLSGVAQTNAALAWLGGGTLAAGGAGISAGRAFLAMAVPVGWAIGGAALVGGGLLANSKNKKIAAKADQQSKEIAIETSKLSKLKAKINAEIKAMVPLNEGVNTLLDSLTQAGKNDYKKFTDEEKDALMELMNTSETLSKRIGVKIA